MQHHLKALSKSFCLFAVSCALLSPGLFGLQQHTPTAHAAPAHITTPGYPRICLPPCGPPPGFHDVYVFTSYAIWGHNGATSDLIDNNQIGMTNGNQVSHQFGPLMAVVARGSRVYEQRSHFLFAIVLGGCTTPTGYCLTELDDNPETFSVAAGTSGQLYELRSDGTAWQSTGLCLHCWAEIDNHVTLRMVAASHLYELREGRTVWRYDGCAFCWTEVDSNSTILDLVVDSNGVLYEERAVQANGVLVSSSTLKGIGPFNFQALDTVDITQEIVASSRLYQLRINGTLFIYQGGSPAWQNIGTASLVEGDLEPGASSDAVYQRLSNNSIWEFTPESGSWIEISAPFSDQVTISVPASLFLSF
jgi:hypothetical protein